MSARLRGPPSARGALGCGASPFPPSSPGSGRVPAVRRGRPGAPSPRRPLPRLLPRQLLVAAVIRLSALVRGARGERASDSRFQDSPVGSFLRDLQSINWGLPNSPRPAPPSQKSPKEKRILSAWTQCSRRTASPPPTHARTS